MSELMAGFKPRAASKLGFRHRFVVRDYEVGLLYRYGHLEDRLTAGRHVRWGFGWTVELVDLRLETITVASQDILTSDQVGIRVTVLVELQVTDPVKSRHSSKNSSGHVYSATQQILRSQVSNRSVDVLISQRMELGSNVREALMLEAERVGISILSVHIKDVTFPAELKKSFSEVIRARQEGQAALERARGETAALRNLANAARMLENNPALQNLRWLQTISELGAKGGSVVVHLSEGPKLGSTPVSSEGKTN